MRIRLVIVALVAVCACQSPMPMDRTAETKAMLVREIPVGTRRDVVIAKLDSLKIPHSNMDSGGLTVRALVRNTSRSAVATGSLQVMLYFAADSILLRHEFKEMFVAP